MGGNLKKKNKKKAQGSGAKGAHRRISTCLGHKEQPGLKVSQPKTKGRDTEDLKRWWGV